MNKPLYVIDIQTIHCICDQIKQRVLCIRSPLTASSSAANDLLGRGQGVSFIMTQSAQNPGTCWFEMFAV